MEGVSVWKGEGLYREVRSGGVFGLYCFMGDGGWGFRRLLGDIEVFTFFVCVYVMLLVRGYSRKRDKKWDEMRVYS